MRRGLVKALPTLLAVPSAAVVGGIVYTSLLRERQSSHFQAQSRNHSGDLTPRDAPKGSWPVSHWVIDGLLEPLHLCTLQMDSISLVAFLCSSQG